MSDAVSELDILNKINEVDLSTVQTRAPLPAPGLVKLNIVSVEVKKDESKDGTEKKPYVMITFALADPWKQVDGTPLNPGFQVFERVYVQDWTDPKTGEVKNFGRQRLAQLREAVFGKAPPGTAFRPDELLGQTISATLVYDPAPKGKDGKAYGPRTEVGAYVLPKLTK